MLILLLILASFAQLLVCYEGVPYAFGCPALPHVTLLLLQDSVGSMFNIVDITVILSNNSWYFLSCYYTDRKYSRHFACSNSFYF